MWLYPKLSVFGKIKVLSLENSNELAIKDNLLFCDKNSITLKK